MNIAVSTASFGRPLNDGRLHILDFPEVCEGFGLEAIELNDFAIKDDWDVVRELKRRAARFGIGICAVAAESNFYKGTPEEIDAQREHLLKYLDIAHYLGAAIPRVDTCPYGRDMPGKIIPEGVAHAMAFDAAVRTWQAIMPAADERGITCAVENHGDISRTSADQVRLTEAVASDRFGIDLDTGNYHADPMAGTDPFDDVLDQTRGRSTGCFRH